MLFRSVYVANPQQRNLAAHPPNGLNNTLMGPGASVPQGQQSIPVVPPPVVQPYLRAVQAPAVPHTNGGIPLSFMDILKSGSKIVAPKTSSIKNGKPGIKFLDNEVQVLSTPFMFSLVGKFTSKTPPKISEIMPEFKKISLKKGFSLSMLDNRHLLISLNLEEDFTKLWLKGSLFINGHALHLTKWTPSFTDRKSTHLNSSHAQ